MSRAHVYKLLQDAQGNLITNATVTVCQAGTSTPISGTLWENNSTTDTGQSLPNPFTTTSGVIEFYLDDQQKILLEVVTTGSTPQIYDNIDAIDVLQVIADETTPPEEVTSVVAPVRCASGTFTGAYVPTGGSTGRGQITGAGNTLDGQALVQGNRVLICDPTGATQNPEFGVYVVTTLGTGTNGVWDRATDFDNESKVVDGVVVPVYAGSHVGLIQLAMASGFVIGGGSGSSLNFEAIAMSMQILLDLIAALAPLDSPALTGNPTAPTPTEGDSSQKIATTAFVAEATETIACTIYNAGAAQSISQSGSTVGFSTFTINTGESPLWHSSNPNEIVIVEPGLYKIWGKLTMAGTTWTAGDYAEAAVQLNGSTLEYNIVYPPAATIGSVPVPVPAVLHECSAGDIITLYGLQTLTSGTFHNVQGSTNTSLSVEKVGS